MTKTWHKPNPARNQQIVELFTAGKTMQEIADQFDISRERVRQILTRMGIKAENGGAAKRK